ncbi:hypothetical protein VIBNISOn1_570024 [Vibrio nigripulchritudo SOn1]|uniref:Uncharacterized protein n=1 Tax=Vibrio nigripulchritudo SOn1 TaxID=1238450 RepID=A0AAV2VW92_9VIBR|nr:hypothetical protein VIBNISOn1_570024 [Vibrio nigripulchritudo SOn1]
MRNLGLSGRNRHLIYSVKKCYICIIYTLRKIQLGEHRYAPYFLE